MQGISKVEEEETTSRFESTLWNQPNRQPKLSQDKASISPKPCKPSYFACPHCDYTSLQKCHVKRHIMCKHMREKPFQCHVCMRRFAQKQNLRTHFRLHTGEKPFQCNHCSLRFTHKLSLMAHTAKYHPM